MERALLKGKKQHERERLTIGQVAYRSGINAKAIWYDESIGVLVTHTISSILHTLSAQSHIVLT
jgi:hypothetical protein